MIWVQECCPETLPVQNREQKERGCPLASPNLCLCNQEKLHWETQTLAQESTKRTPCESKPQCWLLVFPEWGQQESKSSGMLLRALPALLRILFLSQNQHNADHKGSLSEEHTLQSTPGSTCNWTTYLSTPHWLQLHMNSRPDSAV